MDFHFPTVVLDSQHTTKTHNKEINKHYPKPLVTQPSEQY